MAGKKPAKQGLLGVHPVPCLREDQAGLALHDPGGDFLSPVRRQAVHEFRVRRSLCHQRFIHLEATEVAQTLGCLGFLAHAGPDIGVDDIGIGDGTRGIRLLKGQVSWERRSAGGQE